jgi:hypothetical protein
MANGKSENKEDTIIKYDIYSKEEKIGSSVNIRKSVVANNLQTVINRTNTIINISYLLFKFQITSKDTIISKKNELFSYESTYNKNNDISKFRMSKNSDNYLTRFESDDKVIKQIYKKGSFDFLSCQLPYSLNKNKQKQLNIETGKVIPVSITKLENEKIVINNQTYDCKVISLKTAKRAAKLWIGSDKTGAFLVKEKGTDKDGPYEILLDSYKG